MSLNFRGWVITKRLALILWIVVHDHEGIHNFHNLTLRIFVNCLSNVLRLKSPDKRKQSFKQ